MSSNLTAQILTKSRTRAILFFQLGSQNLSRQFPSPITNLTAPARSPLLFQPPKLPQELLSLCLFSMPSGYYNKQKQNRSYLPCPDCLIFSSETWKDALLDSCSDRVIHSKSGREAMLGCTRRAERKASQSWEKQMGNHWRLDGVVGWVRCEPKKSDMSHCLVVFFGVWELPNYKQRLKSCQQKVTRVLKLSIFNSFPTCRPPEWFSRVGGGKVSIKRGGPTRQVFRSFNFPRAFSRLTSSS